MSVQNDRVERLAAIQKRAQESAAEAPPLTAEQLDRLSVIFHRGRARPAAPKPEPRATQIYRHYDKCGCLLYVGISYDAIKRNYAHAGSSWWTKWVDRIQIHETTYEDRAEAAAAERTLIRDEEPVFNTVHAIDKRTAIIRYLILHEHWEHLSTGTGVGQAQKADLLQRLNAAQMYTGISYFEEPVAHVVDWKDPVVRRFIVKSEIDDKGCHRWQGHIAPNGLGTFRHPKTKWANRAAYLLFRGPIPARHEIRPGLQCSGRDCVNPTHLQCVPEETPRPNIVKRAERCEGTHPGERSRWHRREDGRWYCRSCNTASARRRRALGANE